MVFLCIRIVPNRHRFAKLTGFVNLMADINTFNLEPQTTYDYVGRHKLGLHSMMNQLSKFPRIELHSVIEECAKDIIVSNQRNCIIPYYSFTTQ